MCWRGRIRSLLGVSREARGGETRNEFNAWKNLCLGTGSSLLTTAPLAQGQQPTSRPRIGYVSGVSLPLTGAREASSRGLRELGYVEEKPLSSRHRYSEGNYNRLAGLATELVRLKPDLIVTGGSPSTRAAKEVTGTIPIVMTNDPDPVANGFVAGLALPAGNVTGLSTLAPELSGKRLGILREVIPTITRIAVLATSTSPAYAPVKKRSTSPPRLSSCSFNTKTFWIAKTSNRHFELQPKVERMRSSRSTAVFWFPKPRRLCRSPQRAGSRQRIAKLSTLTLGD